MKHIKVKKNKHLIIFEVNAEIPHQMANDLATRLQQEIPEFKTMITQSDLTILTLEDEIVL